MDVQINQADGKTTVAFVGSLDTAAAVQCKEDLQPVFDKASQSIVLDCARMDYISSSGLRIFISLLKQVTAAGGTLQIINLNSEVRNVFVLTGFAKRFNIAAKQ